MGFMARHDDVADGKSSDWIPKGHLLDNLLNASPDRIDFKDLRSRFTRMNHAKAAILLISACCGFALGGCSLFRHHQRKPDWPPKNSLPPGPMEPDPQPMEMNPVEPNPQPLQPAQDDPQ